jgi:hypothetical protein
MKTKDTVGFRSTLSKSKEYEVAGKTNKKANQEDIDKALSWVQSDHDKTGGASSGLSMSESAKVMLKSSNGSGEAWQGQMASLSGCLRDLIPDDGKALVEADDDEEVDEEEKDPNGDDEGDEDGWETGSTKTATTSGSKRKAEPKSESGKKAKWFDRSKAVASATRSLKLWKDQQAKAGAELVVNMTMELSKVSTVGVEYVVENEVVILTNRMDMLKLVVNIEKDGPQILQDRLKSIEDTAETKKKAVADSKGDPYELAKAARERMTHAPPCRLYKDLTTLKQLADDVESCHLAETQKEIDDILETLKPKRAAVNDLLSTSNAALTNLQSRVAAALARRKAEAAAT